MHSGDRPRYQDLQWRQRLDGKSTCMANTSQPLRLLRTKPIMKVYGLFLLSSTASSVSASLKPLGTVFSVSVDSKTSSGCQKYFEANPKKPGKALNLAWQQIYEMNEAALKVLDDDNYESDEEIRRLATRFFGIKPKRTASGMGSKAVVKEAIPIAGDDLDKLNSVKRKYAQISHRSLAADSFRLLQQPRQAPQWRTAPPYLPRLREVPPLLRRRLHRPADRNRHAGIWQRQAPS